MNAHQVPAPHVADDGRVRIRPFRLEDVEPLFEAVIASRREVMRWLPWCHPAYAIEETRAWVEGRPEAWESGAEYGFVVESVADGRFLGGNSIYGVGRGGHAGGLGYWMRTDVTGQGLTTAAARLALAFGFEVLGLERIEIMAMTENLASRKVAEKLGATFEGILRGRIYFQGKVRDAACYSLLPGEL